MHRTSLSSIFGNRRRHSEYTSYQRGLVARAITYGARPCQLRNRFGLSRHIIRIIVENVLVRHNDESKSRSERLKKLSIRDERHILRIVRRELKIIYKNLAKKIDVFVSHDTLYRLLKEKSIINGLFKKRSLLTFEMASKRYAWAIAYEHGGFENGAKIIGSDECFVERGTSKRREWCFRTSTQKWNKAMIQSYKKGHDDKDLRQWNDDGGNISGAEKTLVSMDQKMGRSDDDDLSGRSLLES